MKLSRQSTFHLIRRGRDCLCLKIEDDSPAETVLDAVLLAAAYFEACVENHCEKVLVVGFFKVQ